ncbi:undecaprenyl/decaprenyl-phosphate alpha-N-acetylglucosaminyl 1-phosphate transferase [Candidatus Pelagibacter sp.]|nr:undecaprenyl/decaprenyl-phosphate alpha-N-acetylglucosaminyl 1-phosphate transferase [Candidatus Pelagibacter sp.]
MFETNLIAIQFLIGLIFLSKFKLISNFINLFDHPDYKRKIHNKKISCIGGLFIFFNIIIILFCNFFLENNLISKYYFDQNIKNFILFFFALTIIFLMGLFDDIYVLKPNIKFFTLIVIISCLVMLDQDLVINFLRFSFFDTVYDISKFSLFFTIFCIIVFINAFNMYDGSNLQASSISVIIFTYILFLQKSIDIFSISLIISLIFFSILNYKNKLFLGDNGSLILSFIISYVFIKFYNKQIIFYADQVCLFMLLPVIDLLRLFIVRIWNEKSPFKPDKKHLHHILLKKFKPKVVMPILLSIYFFPVLFGVITKEYLVFMIVQIIFVLGICIFLNSKSKKNVKSN